MHRSRLYRHVLGVELGDFGEVVRARKPSRLPVVLTRQEVQALLARLDGDAWLAASLMDGSGLRLMECLRLRVQDVEFSRGEINVRDGKGSKDRVTMLPDTLRTPLRRHLDRVRVSFLIHPASQLVNGAEDDNSPVIHLRFEPSSNVPPGDFIRLLEPPVENAIALAEPLGEISGLNAQILAGGDWARGWHLVGVSSEWVLSVLEDHQATPTPQQLVQLLHYVTDGVGLGGSCLFVPGGFIPF